MGIFRQETGMKKNGMFVTSPAILLPLIVMLPIAPSSAITVKLIILFFTTKVNRFLFCGFK